MAIRKCEIVVKNNIRILDITNKEDATDELIKIGADPDGIKIMVNKMSHFNLKVSNLDVRQANIIKQELLSLGGEAAVHKNVIVNKVDKTDTIIMGTRKQLKKAVNKLKMQPFGLKKLAKDIEALINCDLLKSMPFECGGKVFDFNDKVYIMGILNITPDSFSDGGNFYKLNYAMGHAEKMIDEGADIIDVGGESTRPGADTVSPDDELKRVIPVIKELKKNYDTVVSIDTYKAQVAKAAIDAGADIVNDISAMRFDDKMKGVIKDTDIPVILMHTKGRPKEMQKNPSYSCVISEIAGYLSDVIDDAVSYGIDSDKIIIDPGIGFGKTHEHNITIIKKLKEFKSLQKPVMIGLSRKSFIGEIMGKGPEDRLNGTISGNVVSVLNGANILRVHDVKEAVESTKVARAFM
jgi:dihydropteroate synthase